MGYTRIEEEGNLAASAADDGLAHAMVGNRRMTQGDLVVGGGEKMGQLIET
jgi:hypothetical protein